MLHEHPATACVYDEALELKISIGLGDGVVSDVEPLASASATGPSLVVSRSRFNLENEPKGYVVNAEEELE